MSDNLGGDSVQITLAVWDSAQAALVGMNPVPLLIASILIGLIQSQRGSYLIKALIALVPAVLIAAAWPAASGFTPIWPDLTQLETQIQLVVLLLMSWVIIRLIWLVKSTLPFGERQPHAKPNGH